MSETDLRRLWSTPSQPRGQPETQSHQAAPDEQEYDTEPMQAHRNGYVPFFLRDRAERLHIKPVGQFSRFPAYTSLLDIVFDHDNAEGFTLVYSFMLVYFEGRNLGPVVHAINYGRCAAIHQYDSHGGYPSAPDPDKPLIHAIEIRGGAVDSGTNAPAGKK